VFPARRLREPTRGVSAVALIVVATIAVAIILAAFLPGAGFIAAIVIAVIGLAAVVWLISAGATRQAPSDVARNTERQELLGPGGPDDPGRP
jgi:fatty acid desaturase